MKSRNLFAASALVLSLNLLLANPARAGELQLRRVGILCLAGDTLIDQHVGITVFSNARREEDIASLGLRAVVAQTMAKQLQNLTGIQAAILPSPAQAIPHSDGADRAAIFQKLSAAYGVDQFLVLMPAQYEDRLGMTNQSLAGIARYEYAGFHFAYAALTLIVVDGATGRSLTDLNFGAAPPKPQGQGSGARGPVLYFANWQVPRVDLPAELRTKPVVAMTQAEREQLRDLLMEILGESEIRPSLERLLGFTNRATGLPEEHPPLFRPVEALSPATAVQPSTIEAASAPPVAGTVVRDRPRSDGRVVQTVPPGTALKFTSQARNAEGDWGYVQSGGVQGWVYITASPAN